jgi:hypothetical protein
MIISYKEFENIFNKTIFGSSKKYLIEKIAENPERYLGIFRPTKPKTKIIQNILQSHEIRFGDALEDIIGIYLNRVGFEALDKKLLSNLGDNLDVDQLVKKNGKIFFVEQKVRDDHDSTKKRGQISNFEKKLNFLCEKYGEDKINSFFYFIDDGLRKNEKYYKEELAKISKSYGVDCNLCYGKEFFSLIKHETIWDEMISNLKTWRQHLPDLPETNFDLNPEESYNEIKDISPAIFRKLFENENVINEIFPIIFPKKDVLNLLIEDFCKRDRKIYQTIARICKGKCL